MSEDKSAREAAKVAYICSDRNTGNSGDAFLVGYAAAREGMIGDVDQACEELWRAKDCKCWEDVRRHVDAAFDYLAGHLEKEK